MNLCKRGHVRSGRMVLGARGCRECHNLAGRARAAGRTTDEQWAFERGRPRRKGRAGGSGEHFALCGYGHRMVGENVYRWTRKDGREMRFCRICHKNRARARRRGMTLVEWYASAEYKAMRDELRRQVELARQVRRLMAGA